MGTKKKGAAPAAYRGEGADGVKVEALTEDSGVKAETLTEVVAPSDASPGIPPEAQATPTPRTLPDALRKNLWQPGQSGNPSGRVKSWLQILREEYGKGAERELVKALYGYALNKPDLANRDKIPAREQVQALEHITSRIWGKPDQRVDVSGTVGVVHVELSAEERQRLYRYVLEGRLDQLEAIGDGEDGQAQAIDVGYEVLPLPGDGGQEETGGHI